MKRTFGIGLSAAAVMLVAAAAMADNPPTAGSTGSSESASTQAAVHPATAKHMHHPGKAGMAKHSMVDLNSASKEDLMKVSGISDATAEKIIAARPFKSRTELVSKNILTKAEFAKIRAWVTAKQAPEASK